MARMTIQGFDEYALKLYGLFEKTQQVCGKAIYKAADIVADAVRENIEALPYTRNQKGTPENPIDGVTLLQKQGLSEGFGIAALQYDGTFYNVKLGFDGYNNVETDQYPNGQPNLLIARSVESGTSFRKKHPFVRPAVNATRRQAEQIMAEVVDEEIEKIMK